MASSKSLGLFDRLGQVFSYGTFVHALAGATGSGVAMVVFYPLDIVRTRLQVSNPGEEHSSIYKIIKRILRQEGIEALYRGIMPVVISIYTSNFVYFYTFHGLKALQGKQDQSVLKDIAFAIIAGTTNVFLTTPMWVVNTRLKLQGARVDSGKRQLSFPPYHGIIDGLVKLARAEGVSGMWSGTVPSLFLTLNPTIHFVLYEGIKRYLLGSEKQLSSVVYFLLGAFAKTIATLVTYPAQLAQSRLRAGRSAALSSRSDKTLSDDADGKKKLRKESMLSVLVGVVRLHGFLGLYGGLEAKILQTVLMAALMFLSYEKMAALIFRLLRASAPPIKK